MPCLGTFRKALVPASNGTIRTKTQYCFLEAALVLVYSIDTGAQTDELTHRAMNALIARSPGRILAVTIVAVFGRPAMATP
jgi:hypothetical protein